MNSTASIIDAFEDALVKRNEAAAAMNRSALDVGAGEIISRMESDCCTSNNYPEEG